MCSFWQQKLPTYPLNGILIDANQRSNAKPRLLEKTAASHHHFLRKRHIPYQLKRRIDQSEAPSARVAIEFNFLDCHRS